MLARNEFLSKESDQNPRRGALPQRDVTPAMHELCLRNLPLWHKLPLFSGPGGRFSQKSVPQRLLT